MQLGDANGAPQQGDMGGNPKAPNVEIKLFVGRVPRSSNEDALRPLFEQFGEIVDMTVIRDRESGAHKGCAFIRMKSLAAADAAIRALNNQKIMDPNLGPLTVKYAQGEAERLGLPTEVAGAGVDQAKLFVGSLPRTTSEDEVKQLFGQYGHLEEVFIMRDEAKASKGCAFVKFTFKEEAIYAVQALNQKVTLPGAPRPLEVRFAATSKKAQDGARPGAARGAPQSGGAKHWTEYFTAEGRPYYYNSLTGQTQWERPAEMDAPAPRPSTGPQTHGPPGANVFIFHIPNEWSENDLLTNFGRYGNILSSRIASDRESGRNRGFGFVSYDNVQAAINAVQGMNGFSVAGKRLKVHIKKGEEAFAPQLQAAPQGPQVGIQGGFPQQQVPQQAYGAFPAYGR